MTSQVRTGRFPLSQLTYGYDGAGNRSTYQGGSWTYNGANQLTNAANVSRTFTYDRRENLATEVISSNTTTFEYDFEQRLKKETLSDSSTVEFVFDSDGTRRRVPVAAGDRGGGAPGFGGVHTRWGRSPCRRFSLPLPAVWSGWPSAPGQLPCSGWRVGLSRERSFRLASQPSAAGSVRPPRVRWTPEFILLYCDY